MSAPFLTWHAVQAALDEGRLSWLRVDHHQPRAPRPQLEVAFEWRQCFEPLGLPATVGRDGRPADRWVGPEQPRRSHLKDVAKAVRIALAVAAFTARGHDCCSSCGWRPCRDPCLWRPGGIGGSPDGQRDFDESSDLPTLARTAITVVCAGVKSILDCGDSGTPRDARRHRCRIPGPCDPGVLRCRTRASISTGLFLPGRDRRGHAGGRPAQSRQRDRCRQPGAA